MNRKLFGINKGITIRRTLVLSLLVIVLLGSLSFGVQQAYALSVGESASYTILLPTDEIVLYQTYKTLGVVPTIDGLAYAIASETKWYSYDPATGKIGDQLLWRQLGLALISVATSKLLYSQIDWRWYSENGEIERHHISSVKFKYVGKTAIADCVAYVLSPETPEKVTGHFKIRDADSISTQRSAMWYYMLHKGNYEIGKTYRIYCVFWNHGSYTWGYEYDDMKLIRTTIKTVAAGKFLCYYFKRQSDLKLWSPCMSDEYVMVHSKALVYAYDSELGYTIELTAYHAGIT